MGFSVFLFIEWVEKLYKTSNPLTRGWLLLMGFIKRKRLLFSIPRYDFILVHRKITPIGPPVFEWFLAKVMRKKIIFDFDDAIWMSDEHLVS